MLTEHSPSDGSIIRTIPVNCRPCFLAVDGHDRFVISGTGGKIRVADSDGAVLFVIRPKVEGQTTVRCAGVCCDSTGIYVAVNGSDQLVCGHVHRYDLSGDFLGCIAKGLPLLLGLTLTANGQQLAMVDWHGLIKVYQKRP